MAAGMKRLSDLDTVHLKCRVLLHAWDPEVTYLVTVGRKKLYELHLKCIRCNATRVDLLDKGWLERRGYRRPMGYDVVGLKDFGGRKVFNANVRHELVTRMNPIPKPDSKRTPKGVR